MKPTRLNWDTNHGKFIHEYMFYDAVKYVVEYDLGKSGISYDQLKTIDKVDIDFHSRKKQMVIHYTIEDPNDSQKLIEREYTCEFVTVANFQPDNHGGVIEDEIIDVGFSTQYGIQKSNFVSLSNSKRDKNYIYYIPKIGKITNRDYDKDEEVETQQSVAFCTPDHPMTTTEGNTLVSINLNDRRNNITKFNLVDTVKYIIKNNPNIIENYLVENRDSATVRDLFKYYHNKFNPSNPIT